MDLKVSIKNTTPLRGRIMKSTFGGSGTDNYNDLRNKPSINGVTLQGDLTGEQLGLGSSSDVALTKHFVEAGNLNQHVYSNPFVTGGSSEIGKVYPFRATATVLADGSLKIARNSTSSTKSYGFAIVVENAAGVDLTGHKIYFRIAGFDNSGAVHFDLLRYYGLYGNTSAGGFQTELSTVPAVYETIVTPNANVNRFSVLLVPGDSVDNGEYFTIRSIQWIDLTAMFGAGYEPTPETFSTFYGSGMPYPFQIPSIASDFRETKAMLAELAATVDGELALKLGMKPNVAVDTDLDNLTAQGVYCLYSGHAYTNAPPFFTGGSAWVIVVSNQSGAQKLQLFCKTDGKIWAARSFITVSGPGTWGAWIVYDRVYNALLGKKLSIVGDSISTYQGWLPEGYAYYYPHGDVDSVAETWWKRVLNRSGMTLLSNASWSGSSVTDYDDDPVNTAKVAYSDARIADLSVNGESPDIIIVLMGTNDFVHGCAIGSLTEASEIPSGATSIKTLKEAYACLLNKARTAYPHAHIYCCTLAQRYTASDNTYPILNGNGVALAQYNKAIIDVATWMGCDVIRLDTSISLTEIPDNTVDGTLHPNAAGSEKIAQKVLQTLVEKEWY